MVLNSSIELSRGVPAPVKLPEGEDEARLAAVVNVVIPAPMSIVRSAVDAFASDSVNRILLRDTGADVLPHGWIEGPSSNGISVVYGEVEGSKWYTMKTTGSLDVSAHKAAQVLMAADMVPKYAQLANQKEGGIKRA